jgi:transcriptional regulator GlxA family with amidase domain
MSIDCVEALRLDAARHRLQASNATLEIVATTCGFRNSGAMRNTFKRVLIHGFVTFRALEHPAPSTSAEAAA